ncbi:hypothetical protein AFL01nite_05120 [Aeromicrobium flavum]|uniref:Uncharacterized protein n=1 Tax=Aeromicrobium flavum TaxID=416568 RepID=A0A512HS17_9ACTN|nr:hypothetical protein [Aeromicrobium flavum]GEO88185.1 hypothetical protein AFL01nite_05120 [Aeromicrobium flavum]
MSQATVAIIANLALVGVTAIYVYVTFGMGRSARDSARASVAAAQFAARSAQVALATLEVNFTIQPRRSDEDQQGEAPSSRNLTGVLLTSTASNVYVHRMRIDSYGYVSSLDPETWARQYGLQGQGVTGQEANIAVAQDLPIVRYDHTHTFRATGATLPVLLHRSEAVEFMEEGDLFPTPDGSRFSILAATVFYGLDPDSAPRERFVIWHTSDSLVAE